MRGKKAKQLRRLALHMLHKQGTSPSDGYREYNTAMNRMTMAPALDDDGQPIMVGGQATLKPELAPGTITNRWVLRNMYRTLKKAWKEQRRGAHS